VARSIEVQAEGLMRPVMPGTAAIRAAAAWQDSIHV
jgi:hypothetical protein